MKTKFNQNLILALSLIISLNVNSKETEKVEDSPKQGKEFYSYTQKEYRKKRGDKPLFEKSKNKLLKSANCLGQLAGTNYNRTISISTKEKSHRTNFFGWKDDKPVTFTLFNGQAYYYEHADLKDNTYQRAVLTKDGKKHVRILSHKGDSISEVPESSFLESKRSQNMKKHLVDVAYKRIGLADPDFSLALSTLLKASISKMKLDSDNEKIAKGNKGHLGRILKRIRVLNSCRSDLKEFPSILSLIDKTIIELGGKEKEVFEPQDDYSNENRSGGGSSTSK